MKDSVGKPVISKNREKRRSFWRYHIAKVAQDGISIRRYCRDQGLSEASFYSWRGKLRQESIESQGRALVPSSPFTQMRFSGASLSSPIRLSLGQGVILYFDREPSPVWIKDLATVVGQRS